MLTNWFSFLRLSIQKHTISVIFCFILQNRLHDHKRNNQWHISWYLSKLGKKLHRIYAGLLFISIFLSLPIKYLDHDYPFAAAYLPFIIIFPSHCPSYTLWTWNSVCKISEESVINIRIIRIKLAIYTEVTNIFKVTQFCSAFRLFEIVLT